MDAVAGSAVSFRFEEGGVGVLEDSLGRGAWAGGDRTADAQRRVHVLAIDADLSGDRADDRLGARGKVEATIDPFAQDRELVTAKAGGQVVCWQARAQPCGDLTEQPVARIA